MSIRAQSNAVASSGNAGGKPGSFTGSGGSRAGSDRGAAGAVGGAPRGPGSSGSSGAQNVGLSQQQPQQHLMPPKGPGSAGGTRVEFSATESSSHCNLSYSARDTTSSPTQSSSAGGGGGGLDGESIPDVWDNTSEVSMSGYSAHSGKLEDAENTHESYFVRLVKFYQKYNPDKLCRVEEFLAAYKGEEEQLFAILTEKYGPEPEPEVRSLAAGSDGSYFHALGARNVVPKIVTPEDGKTTVPTPYWPMSSAITDPDLMALLRKQVTSIAELQKCYIGLLRDHPSDSWNGMTYITEAPLPTDTSKPFLGHLWSGSLANNKVLVFNRENYHRSVLHCSEECQKTFPHARWRLTMIRHECHPRILLRTMWDPIIRGGGVRPASSSLTEGHDDHATAGDGASSQGGNGGSKPFFSFSWARKKSVGANGQSPQAPPPPHGSSTQVAGGGGTSGHGGSTAGRSRTPDSVSSTTTSEASRHQLKQQQAAARKQQPQQPQASTAPSVTALSSTLIDKFIAQLQALEGRLSERLDDIDRRLVAVEAKVGATGSTAHPSTNVPQAMVAGTATSPPASAA